MDTKVTTVNDTKQGLTMKVGSRHCYARLTSVKVGGEYKMHLNVNWTYQEFLLQDKAHSDNELFISSDDCCDYERITITKVDNKFVVHRDLRQQFRACNGVQKKSAPPSSWKLWLHKFM